MQNLMITHGGALGDSGYSIPALTELRKRHDEIYLSCRRAGKLALGGTGLVDRFIVWQPDLAKASRERRRNWLLHATRDMDFQAKLDLNGVIPGRYLFHENDSKFALSADWKRENAEGVGFFDAFAWRAETPEAVGKRPETRLTPEERAWLRDFRHMNDIPKNAFILGWQFTGSAKIKWYPFFDLVVQKGVMQKHPEVYVIGLGDLERKLTWNREYHGGRFINLGDSISFRRACILTSIFDCLVAPETGIMVFAQAHRHVPKILLATHTYGYHIAFPETVIIQSEAECSPCYNIVFDCRPDGGNPWSLCMGRIPPEKVIAAIEAIMSKRRVTNDGGETHWQEL